MLTDPVVGFPIVGTTLLVGALIGFFIYVSRKLPAPPPFVIELGMFQPVVLWGAIVLGVIIGLVALTRAASCKPAYKGKTALFEPFESPQESTKRYDDYVAKLNAASDRIDDLLNDLAEASDDTCNIIRDVEDIYVGNIEAPPSDDETKLPEHMQKERRKKRRERGVVRFNEERALHAKLNSSHPVYECFENPESSEDAAMNLKIKEDELREAVRELETYLDQSEVRVAATKIEQLHTALNFSEIQFIKAMKEEEKRKKETEGFVGTGDLKGDVLFKKAEDLLIREQKLHDDIKQLLNHVTKTKDLQKQAHKTTNNLEEGKVDETAADYIKASQQPKPDKGRCIDDWYQFGSYAGGFCCPTVPSNYSAELRDYTACPIEKGVCSLSHGSKKYPVCVNVPPPSQ